MLKCSEPQSFQLKGGKKCCSHTARSGTAALLGYRLGVWVHRDLKEIIVEPGPRSHTLNCRHHFVCSGLL